MRFQLFLDAKSEDLFEKATSELGTIFYKSLGEDKGYEIVYFSGSRVARFVGKPEGKLLKLCEACGYEVDSIIVDEANGTLKVTEA